MTTMATEDARHSPDGDLVRLLDDEAGARHAELTAHVTTCPACRSRLESLRRRSTLLTEVLTAADPPPVDRTRVRPPFEQLRPSRAGRVARRRAIWSHPGLRAAAGVLLLAGIAAATPARAWILDRVARLRRDAPSDRAAQVQAPTPLAEPAPSSAVFFAPASAELTIRLQARQADGSIELIAGRESRSSAQVLTNASGEGFLVLPSELQIRNTPGSVARYRIVLSAAIRRVRVDAAGAGTTFLEVTPDGHYVVPLGRSGRAAP
jgi:hypothetical protein